MQPRIKTALFIIALFFPSIACVTLMGGDFPANAETVTPLSEPPVTIAPRSIPHPMTCADDACFNACLKRINDTLETRPFNPLGGEYAGTEANLNLAVYKVIDGKLGEPDMLYAPQEFKPFQEDLEAHQLVWNYASALLPPDKLKWISQYEIFTDGSDNVLAWIGAKDMFDRSHWTLGVDIADAQNPVDLTYTLTHEFGHLITLNTEQIPQTDFAYGWQQNPSVCKQFSNPYGCSLPDSYLNRFYQRFWINIFDEWRETVEKIHTNSYDEQYTLVEEFYKKHTDQFVREYAATNIHEDTAESFMRFVLEPKPVGNGVVDQKILFFYDFPELVAMRAQMIQNICSYVQE